MPLAKGETLQSDQINALFGFDGLEPKEVTAWNRRHKDDFPCRVAFAINQHYPELRSGFYRNRRLVALIQEALRDVGLHVVVEDNFQRDGVVPEEPLGTLEISDDYLLVDESLQVHGRLNVWESAGGKSQFYHDRFIMEIITDQKRGEVLTRSVAEKCRERSVASVMATP